MNYTQAEANQIKNYFKERVSKINDSDFTIRQKDGAYAYLMTELESIYGVPCIFPKQWENEAEGNKILLELYRSISNLRAFEDEATACEDNTNHNIIIVCTPDANDVYPVTIATNDICQTAKDIIGESFDVIRARKLHNILPNAAFLCTDDFNNMKDPRINAVGTYLYDSNCYDIRGTICILKEITHHDFELVGLTDAEACQIQELLIKEMHPHY